MSNVIPPLLCDSPPPLDVQDDDDDFGDFTTAVDLSYPGEALSLPSTPQNTPMKNVTEKLKTQETVPKSSDFSEETVTIEPNCETSEIKMCNGHSETVYSNNDEIFSEINEKDHQDKRKCETPEIAQANLLASPLPASSPSASPPSPPPYEDVPNIEQEEEDIKSTVEVFSSEENTENFVEDKNSTIDTTENSNSIESRKNSFEIKTPSSEELVSCESNKSLSLENYECETNILAKDNVEEKKIDIPLNSVVKQTENDDFNDFQANFDEIIPEDKTETSISLVQKLSEENVTEDDGFDADFDDFQFADTIKSESKSNFQSAPEVIDNEVEIECKNDDDDDFGDFDDYSTQMQQPSSVDSPMIINTEDVLGKSEQILYTMFPEEENDEKEYEKIDFISDNSIFKNVKDIELTIALSYQWSNSESQKMMLKSLNIDRRNILYGPAWNPSMPRYAANLSFAPLEPIKSEISASTTTLQVSSDRSTSNVHGEVQSDWSESTVSNTSHVFPTSNSLILDLEQIVSTLDTAHSPVCTNTHSPVDNDSWDMWLQSLSTNEDELPSTIALKPTSAERSDDFSIPANQHEMEIPSMLKPSFSMMQGDNESVKSLKFTDPSTEAEEKETDDAFDEFTSYKSADETYSTWSSTVPLRESHISSNSIDIQLASNEKETPVDATINEEQARVTIENREQIKICRTEVETLETEVDDDDFTAFQSGTVPVAMVTETREITFEISSPIHSVPLEPLKPTVLSSVPTKIEWPEPGITNDDITNLELSLISLKTAAKDPTSSLNALSQSINPHSNGTPQNHIETSSPVKYIPETKKNCEEDDWTDFVSNQDISSTAPINGIRKQELTQKQVELQTSNLPQYDLLNQISPSHSKASVSKLNQPPLIDPLEQFNKIHQQPNLIVKSAQSESDDDWTDFVSSPAASTNVLNGWTKPQSNQPVNLDWSKPPQFTSWSTNITPNIITNPVHFDLLSNYSQPGSSADLFKTRAGNKKPVSVASIKGNIPSISAMPDLEFIAPRNRTFPKK